MSRIEDILAPSIAALYDWLRREADDVRAETFDNHVPDADELEEWAEHLADLAEIGGLTGPAIERERGEAK